MATFTIATLAGKALVGVPLDDASLDLVVGDLLNRLPSADSAGGVPRLLLGPREVQWSERLADLALAPGTVLTLVLLSDPEKAAADLMGTAGASVRLAAARALRAMGAAAAGQARELADAVLSDPDAKVVAEAMQALRAMGVAAEVGSAAFRDVDMVQLAQDLEDPGKVYCVADPTLDLTRRVTHRLLALLRLCDRSPGQAALRNQTLLRRLAPLDPRAAPLHDQLLGDPLEDPRPEVRLARVAVLAGIFRNSQQLQEVEDAATKLCGVLQGDGCHDVRRRAAAALGRALRHAPASRSVALARAALAAEVEALRRSAPSADCCRMEAVQSLQQLLC